MRVLTAELQRVCNPFSRWIDIDSPISIDEINNFIASNATITLPQQPYLFDWSSPINKEARQDHIQRIAYFVINGYENPIYLDTYCSGLVDDGNHRMCASIIRGERTIPISWSGNVESMKLFFRWSLYIKLLNLDIIEDPEMLRSDFYKKQIKEIVRIDNSILIELSDGSSAVLSHSDDCNNIVRLEPASEFDLAIHSGAELLNIKQLGYDIETFDYPLLQVIQITTSSGDAVVSWNIHDSLGCGICCGVDLDYTFVEMIEI